MSKKSDLQKYIAWYVEETGDSEFEMRNVAVWLKERGYEMPEPKSPLEMLEKELRTAAREHHRQDDRGKSYRAYHAITDSSSGVSRSIWIDIDTAKRPRMERSLKQRREQMVGDAVAISRDAAHWNRRNPNEKAIQIELDFGLDVEIANAADDVAKAS